MSDQSRGLLHALHGDFVTGVGEWHTHSITVKRDPILDRIEHRPLRLAVWRYRKLRREFGFGRRKALRWTRGMR